MVDGVRYWDLLSPWFRTQEQAQEYLEGIRDEYPDARVTWCLCLFNPDSPERMREREKLLEKLR